MNKQTLLFGLLCAKSLQIRLLESNVFGKYLTDVPIDLKRGRDLNLQN